MSKPPSRFLNTQSFGAQYTDVASEATRPRPGDPIIIDEDLLQHEFKIFMAEKLTLALEMEHIVHQQTTSL